MFYRKSYVKTDKDASVNSTSEGARALHRPFPSSSVSGRARPESQEGAPAVRRVDVSCERSRRFQGIRMRRQTSPSESGCRGYRPGTGPFRPRG